MPLTGITVIELGHSVAAPYGGAILAELGADVIKVENPKTGDHTRDWGPPYRDKTAILFDALNRDKRSITVDLKNEPERDALRRLILGKADIVLQNLKPGSIEGFGLGGEDLVAEKPSLIFCNLSAFGRKGPMKAKPGYDPLMQAYGGLMSVTGEDGRPPVRVGVSIIDMGSGMWSVIGILAALNERNRTGKGGVVDTSLYETALAWMTMHAGTYLASGEIPRRHGSGAGQIVPYQVFATRDSYLMVAAGNDNLFRRLCGILNRPDWPEDPRFASNGQRVQNRDALIPQIEEILATETTAVWAERLDEAGVPNAPLQSADAVAADPQTQALGMIQKAPDRDMSFMGLPLSFNGDRPPFRLYAPDLGADNDLLLSEIKKGDLSP